MTPRQKRAKRLEDAIDNLAALFDFGALLAVTDPAALLEQATKEIVDSRMRHAGLAPSADASRKEP